MWKCRIWGSHPDADNDDLWQSEEFETEAEVRAWLTTGNGRHDNKPYNCIETISPNGEQTLQLPTTTLGNDDDDDYLHERAMEIGMGLGVDAYNEAMGWDAHCPADES